jgi:hypothetical protein
VPCLFSVDKPIVKISVRVGAEAIQAREQLAVQNDPQFPGQLPSLRGREPGLQVFGGAIEVVLFGSHDQADHCSAWRLAPQGILDGLFLLSGRTLRALCLRGLRFHALKQKQTEQNQRGVECLRHGPFDLSGRRKVRASPSSKRVEKIAGNRIDRRFS